jgi:hypothetical protein
LPPNLRDWVPVGHLAHFILDVVEQLDCKRHARRPMTYCGPEVVKVRDTML